MSTCILFLHVTEILNLNILLYWLFSCIQFSYIIDNVATKQYPCTQIFDYICLHP